MNTNFNYTSPDGLTLNQSTEALMLAVDNFHYNVLNPDFSSFGEIHNTLDIRLVSKSDIKKRTINLELGYLRERLNKMLTRNQQIRKQYEETRVESILAGLCDTSYFEDIVNQHAGEDDTVVVAIETFQERLGYYTRENGRGLIVLVKKRDENQMVATLIHEYIHAWADKKATGGMNDAEYAEEEIAEYGMLHFLQAIAGSDNQFHQILLDAINDVENKKGTLGLVHYGFGAELYYNYAHIEWERLLRDAHTLVGTGILEYEELTKMLQVYPEESELNKVANLLYNMLLTNGSNTKQPKTITTKKNASAPNIKVKEKIHSNVEITCVTLPNGGCVITKVDIRRGRNNIVDIPSSIKKGSKEYPITAIGSLSFPPIDSNITVRIPDSVTNIAPDAFGGGCVVIYTDKDAFEYYDRARTILKGYAGESKEINIPDKVISIGPSACENNHVIEKIIIPSSVIHIWDNAFVGCDRIKNMDIPASLVFIGAGARIIKNEFEFADAKMTILKKYLGRDSRVSIPDTVMIIAPLAFDNRSSNLETVDVPSSITNISVNAFNGCSRLKNVKIPSTVNLIGDNTYNDFIKASNPKHTNSDFVFADAGETILWRYSGHSPVVTIPNTVTTIAPSAFEKCRELQSITIPPSVTQIWDKAFAGCDRLRNVTIPDSVDYIGKNAFEDVLYISYLGSGADGFPWGALQLVVDGDFAFKDTHKTCLSRYLGGSDVFVIPNSVTTVGKYAFKGRKNLTITIPNSVTTIESDAFSGCDQLSVYSGNVDFPWRNITGFEYADAGMTILKKYHGYRAPDSIPSSITQIEENAFEGFTFNHSYSTNASGFPWGAKYVVGDFEYADAGMTHLKKYVGRSDTVVIPNSVTHIEDGAFAACNQIEEIKIPDSVSFIGNVAFLGLHVDILGNLINTKTIDWFIRLAKQGNKDAQYYLGKRYYCSDDYQEAKHWFEKAASQGHKDALYCLGEIYYIGQGVEIDKESSANYFIEAAKSGCSEAKDYLHKLAEEKIPGAVEWCLMEKAKEQYSEAERYRRGDNRAFLLNLKSARAGYADAIIRLKELAENGNHEAKFELGEMYHNGNGVAMNEMEALKWYSKAATHNHAKALNIIMQLAEEGCYNAITVLKRLAYSNHNDSAYRGLKQLADQGNVEAQYVYGSLLEQLKRNEEAKEYYFKAMLLGHSDAKEAYRRLNLNN